MGFVCTNFLLCGSGALITDGGYIYDLRDNDNNNCPQILDMCCPIGDTQKEFNLKSEPL